MTLTELPPPVHEIVECLSVLEGVVAVVLGGSRGQGLEDAHSDWDLGVYYRAGLELGPIQRFGEIHPPGSWGRVMNGGAWLQLADIRVDVLFRDLGFVEECIARAQRGDYDVDALLGYVAGVPTYSLMAEAATCQLLRGVLQQPHAFPEELATRAPPRWRVHRDFSLRYARALARRGDRVPATGQVAKAVLEEAHARACEQRVWYLNEKRLVDTAGLSWAHDWLAHAPSETRRFEAWIDEGQRRLGA